jgi:hypothetical protein
VKALPADFFEAPSGRAMLPAPDTNRLIQFDVGVGGGEVSADND